MSTSDRQDEIDQLDRIVAGTAALGGLYHEVDDQTAVGALATGWEHGVRRFDTAPHYGVGTSERRTGAFLQTVPRDEFVLSTKIGRILVPDRSRTDDDGEIFFGTDGGLRRELDYSGDGARRSLADSQTRLGLDRIDIALVHDPEHHLDDALTGAAGALSELRGRGEVSSWGVGTNFVDAATAFVERTDADRILIAGRWSLLDRRAEPLLELAATKGLTVMVAGVFNGGLLVGSHADLPMFDYAPAPEPLRAAAAAMERLCADHGVSLRAAALQFPSRHSAVAQTVIGAGTPTEMADSLAELAVPIPDELWAQLENCVPDQSLLS